MAKLIVLILCVSIAATQKNGQINQSLEKGNRIGDQELREIHRQNQITQQILSNYLERRLFPFRRPQQRVPSIDEILPTSTEQPRNLRQSSNQNKRLANSNNKYNKNSNINNKNSDSDYDDDDNDGDHDHQYDDELSDDGVNIDDYIASNEQYPETLQSVESEHLDSFYDQGLGHIPKDTTFINLLRAQKLQLQLQEIQNRATILSEQSDYSESNRNNRNIELNDYEVDEPGISSMIAISDIKLALKNCPNCVDDTPITNRWTMPLLKLGEKRYYLGIFFKANWFRANQYCRFHGMHLASISSQEENDKLEKHIKDFGLGHEHFWTSGTDLADEGSFFWMATGRPITFTNWNAGEPNNFRYENGEEENCLELWNRDGKGLKWNDSPCSFETFFVCEVQ